MFNNLLPYELIYTLLGMALIGEYEDAGVPVRWAYEAGVEHGYDAHETQRLLSAMAGVGEVRVEQDVDAQRVALMPKYAETLLYEVYDESTGTYYTLSSPGWEWLGCPDEEVVRSWRGW